MLTKSQTEQYRERGYCFPIRVLDDAEAIRFRDRFLDYTSQRRDILNALAPRDQYAVLSETHTYLRWVFDMASHPAVLDVVEAVLGPNLLIWGSRWFSKMPGDKTYVSWHQDATYWGLQPPSVTTAWIALSDSTRENGCMRVIPGTQQGDLLPQRETYALENALSRGQEIAVEVDESRAIDIVLHPGEMSLHHIGIVHGSERNASSKPRIGLAVRYITPEVKQDAAERSIAILVRGKDEYGHFDLVDPPVSDRIPAPDFVPEAVRRMMRNVMPSGFAGAGN